MKLLSQIKNTENEQDFSHLLYAGDYAVANFLNLYSEKCAVLPEKDYPDTMKEELDISEVRVFHKMMIAKGYLEPCPISDRLENSAMEDLVKIAEEIGLATVGTRDELLQRLELNADMNDVLKYLPPEDIYSLSEKGKAYLKEHEDLIDLYQNRQRYHIDYNEYAAGKSKNMEAPYHEILWKIMNDRFQTYVENTEYDLVQNEYMNMYALFLDEGRNSEALEALLTHFYMVLNAFPETVVCIERFKRSAESVSTFLGHAELPHVIIKECHIKKIKALYESYDISIAHRICQNDGGFFVDEEHFEKILSEIFNDTFNCVATEAEINEHIPVALDHLLRSTEIQ